VKKPIPKEHEEQVAFFKRVRFYRQYYPVLWMVFSTHNGVRVSIGTAKKLKAEGMESGIPDIICDVPKNGYHGLRIELKRRAGGTVSPTQAEYLARYQVLGFKAVVCKGCDEAWAVLCDYLGIRNPEG
jgi:hypothetical protein